MVNPALRDRRILVVEDEYLIAITLADALQAAGSVVIGPAPSIERAIKLIESNKIDAAVLDVNLGGSIAYPVAEALVTRKIPFVFTSGYDHSDLRSRYPQVTNCLKPYLFPQIEKILASVLAA